MKFDYWNLFGVCVILGIVAPFLLSWRHRPLQKAAGWITEIALIPLISSLFTKAHTPAERWFYLPLLASGCILLTIMAVTYRRIRQSYRALRPGGSTPSQREFLENLHALMTGPAVTRTRLAVQADGSIDCRWRFFQRSPEDGGIYTISNACPHCTVLCLISALPIHESTRLQAQYEERVIGGFQVRLIFSRSKNMLSSEYTTNPINGTVDMGKFCLRHRPPAPAP